MDKNNPKSSDADAIPGKDASHDSVWRYEVPQQNAGAGKAEASSAHYTGGAGGGVAGGDQQRDGGFLHSEPEDNVVAPGAPQSGRGSAEGSAHGMGGAGGGQAGGGGAGGGAAPGNGSKDEPIWGS